MAKPQSFCIFCGSGNLSKEHLFWPEWATPYLANGAPGGGFRRELQVSVHGKTRAPVAPPNIKLRPGAVTTKKLRVVCKKCNEGWMGMAETAVKPIFIPLFTGQATTLDRAQQHIVAKWITMKIMVAEHSKKGDDIYDSATRSLFRETHTVPVGMNIWLAKCDDELFAQSYRRDAAVVNFTPIAPSTGLKKNLQGISFGVGSLFVHVVATTLPNLNVEGERSNLMLRLWPIENEIMAWPPARALTAAEADFISRSLDRAFQAPRFRYLDMPQK